MNRKIALGIALICGALIASIGIVWLVWVINSLAWRSPIPGLFAIVLICDGAFFGLLALGAAAILEDA